MRKGMTIETLEKYRGIAKNVEAIQLEIEALYSPVTSPNGNRDMVSFSGTPSDPTARAVRQIMKLQENLSIELAEQIKLLDEITEWMSVVEHEDPELVAIIRMHYIAGLSWRKTNRRLYGYDSYHTARKKVFRYFGHE